MVPVKIRRLTPVSNLVCPWPIIQRRSVDEKTIGHLKSVLGLHTIATIDYQAYSTWQDFVNLAHDLLTARSTPNFASTQLHSEDQLSLATQCDTRLEVQRTSRASSNVGPQTALRNLYISLEMKYSNKKFARRYEMVPVSCRIEAISRE